MELRDYQKDISRRGAEILRQRGVCYLAMECRTGKTLTALATAALYGARRVLFVTKRMARPSVLADYNTLAPSFDFEITTHDSVHKVTVQPDLVIIDEAHSIGAYPRPSLRAKTLRVVCRNAAVILMSGTPSPESYAQLYHQFWITPHSPWSRYSTFYKWAKDYCDIDIVMRAGFPTKDYSHARKELVEADIRPLCIDYTQDEAGFTANITEDVLTVQVSDATAQAITILRRDNILSVKGHPVVADTPAKLLTKLHQLSSGTVISDDGNRIITDPAKALFIREHFAGQKIAIFYVYQSELELLQRAFPNHTLSPEEFQASSDKVFIGQVRSAREGVRLDSADALIFYNLEYSYLSYEQGRNRLVSKERSRPARTYFIVSHCGIERDILDAVHGKSSFTLSYYGHKLKQRGEL